MKKEYLLITALLLFLLATILDSFAGPVALAGIRNPLTFLSGKYLTLYPFTATAIAVRTGALLLSTVLLFSTVEKKYGLKALVLTGVAVLAELYAIQQIATGTKITTIQWTLAIAYAGMTAVIPVIYFLVRALIDWMYTLLTKENAEVSPQETSETPKSL